VPKTSEERKEADKPSQQVGSRGALLTVAARALLAGGVIVPCVTRTLHVCTGSLCAQDKKATIDDIHQDTPASALLAAMRTALDSVFQVPSQPHGRRRAAHAPLCAQVAGPDGLSKVPESVFPFFYKLLSHRERRALPVPATRARALIARMRAAWRCGTAPPSVWASSPARTCPSWCRSLSRAQRVRAAPAVAAH
jgi:hypothetical protein